MSESDLAAFGRRRAPDAGQYQYATSIRINDSVVIDAGSIGFHDSAQDQARIRHILLSDSHIDHTGSLPIFVENAFEAGAARHRPRQ